MNRKLPPNIYRRRYKTRFGYVRVLYCPRFVSWDGKRRTFPGHEDFAAAKTELARLLVLNADRYDFDRERAPLAAGMTFRQWCERYFKSRVDPGRRQSGLERDRYSYKALAETFGDMPLEAITIGPIMEYRRRRLTEPRVYANGRKRPRSYVTVNRELVFLRAMLRLAFDDRLIPSMPNFKGLIKSEKPARRERVCSPAELAALLGHLSRPNGRVIEALYYTAMRLNEVIALPWAYVDERAGFIRLPPEYVKEKKPRLVPICAELRAILSELRREQRFRNSQFVFTRRGKPMRDIAWSFREAKKAAGITDLRLHDFRHTAVTRWAVQGIPQAAIMAAAGHHTVGQSQDYTNVKEDHLTVAFGNVVDKKPKTGS